MSSPEIISVDELIENIPSLKPEATVAAFLAPQQGTNPFGADTFHIEQAIAQEVGVDTDSHGAQRLATSRTPAANLLREYAKAATARPSGLWITLGKLDALEAGTPHFSSEWMLGFGGCGRGRIALKDTVLYAPEIQHPQNGKNRANSTVTVLARVRDGKITKIEDNPFVPVETPDLESTTHVHRDNAIGSAFRTNGHLTGWRP